MLHRAALIELGIAVPKSGVTDFQLNSPVPVLVSRRATRALAVTWRAPALTDPKQGDSKSILLALSRLDTSVSQVPDTQPEIVRRGSRERSRVGG